MTLLPQIDDLLELRHQAHTLGLASHHLVNSTFSGLYASVFRGAGLDFEEVREYREGDDIRNMDWNVTARTNKPHLKVFREERERSVILCVDKGPHMGFGTRGTFKSVQAARAAALLGWAANRQHDRVGGLLYGDASGAPRHFRPTRDRRALWRLLETLSHPAERASSESDPLLRALKRADRGAWKGSVLFVIGELNRETAVLESTLGGLCQRHSVIVIPIDDPADWDLPAMGKVVFYGPDGGMAEIDTDDPVGRRLYREAWEQRRSDLQSVTNGLGITLIPILTNDDVHRALAEGLQRRTHVRVFR